MGTDTQTNKATDIQIKDLTNGQVVNGAWSGDGIFDKLLSAVNDNIELQYTKGRIKGTDYANVYLGSIQAVLQESLQFLLQERLVEVQVDNALKDLDIKSIQAEKEQYGLDEILPLEKSKLCKTVTNLSAQTKSTLKDVKIKGIQEKQEQYSLDNILPQQLLLTYTERVIKDKEAAALGMDNVISANTRNRNNDDNYVYSPFYTLSTTET